MRSREDPIGPDPFSEAQRAEIERLRADLLATLEAETATVRARLQLEEWPPTLRVNQACDLFGISRSQFDRWLADGRTGLRKILIPVGRQWRVPREQFFSWLIALRERPLQTRGRGTRPLRSSVRKSGS